MKTKRTTIKDIAREAGVSPALVSFALRNYGSGKRSYRVNSETESNVLEVAKRLNYIPNTSARALKSGKFNTIGVILSDISSGFFSEIARLIEDEAYRRNYSVLFGSTDENLEKLRQLINVFEVKGVDGLIIVPSENSAEAISSLKDEDIPVVLLDRNFPKSPFPSVVLDNEGAGYEITSRLIGKGYRRIEMVSYTTDISNIRGREKGYLKCMEDNGLKENEIIVRIDHGEVSERIDGIIEDAREKSVEALFFATNTLAISGMTSIYRKGLQAPRDFGVACFDHNVVFDMYDTAIIYALQPIDKFARDSFETLYNQMNGGEAGEKEISLNAEIIDMAR